MPFYRVHSQTASKYFAGYGHHELDEEFYTSDFDLANLITNKFGASIRLVPFTKIMGLKALDIRFAHFNRNDGLSGNILSAEVSFEF